MHCHRQEIILSSEASPDFIFKTNGGPNLSRLKLDHKHALLLPD